MALTTVLLADLPPMLEDMVCGVLQSGSDLQVIRGSASNSDLIGAAAAAGAHVVVVSRRDPADLCAVDPRLAQAAAVSVIALSPNGSWACLHTLHPEATRLEDLSTAQILAALARVAPMGRA